MSRSVAVGQTIGPAILTKFIGEGAVGVVYLATHRTLGIDVAVKILKDESNHQTAVWRDRFHREAQITARLNHPGIVRVLDFGEDHGRGYMVMEYVDGLSLEKWLLRQRGAIPEVTGLRILLATAFALSAAHAEGITHRDLKPSNLLLTKKGQLKLADLGLAREMGSAHLTRDRVAVGTPAYMAPESLTPGSTPDFRVDLYALGVMGYVLAFGKLPYNGDVTQVLAGHLRGNADFMCPTTWSGPAVQLVRRLLSVDPAKRPPHALSVVTTVRGFLAGTGRHRREAAQSSGSSSDITQLGRFLDGAFAAHTTTVEGRTITHTTRSERRLVWTVLAVVILIAGSGWWLSRGEARSAAASTQPAKLADSAEASVVPAPEKVGGGTQ